MTVVAWALLDLLGCGVFDNWIAEEPVGPPPVEAGAEVAQTPQTIDGAKTKLQTVEYRWNPTDGDASVPVEWGGPGFTGKGWSTRTEITQVAVADAPQGGTFVTDMPDWPATFRVYGPYVNSSVNYTLRNLVYQTLLDLDPVTSEYVPSLASHWWVSPDRSTFRFRINPAARWSDGTEVTANDVVATFRLLTDPTLADPTVGPVWAHFEAPLAVSKYIVEVRATDDRWSNFHFFATDLFILPAAEIGSLSGETYLDRYQLAYTAGTGPYRVVPDDVKSGESLALTRRRDWWMEDNPAADGWFNFDRIQFVVVKDAPLAFEKLKKGELDYFVVRKAQWWAEELPGLDIVKRGLLVPHKYFNELPAGFAGLAINLQRVDDVQVRRALQMLFDRETMISKLLYREYEPLASYFPASPYANPANELVAYDEAGAVALLERAGWSELDENGFRTKDGSTLTFVLTYATPAAEKFLTLFQQSCKRAGIKIELQQLSSAAAHKASKDKEFVLYFTQWSGELFPNPETMWHSSLAFKTGNNNITNYANPNVDALLDRYGREYDLGQRAEILRQIDALLAADLPYVLGWYPPAQRVVYWNRFGTPPWGTTRTGTWAENESLWVLWWVDPLLDQQLAAAKTDSAVTMERRPVETRFWPQWSAAHR